MKTFKKIEKRGYIIRYMSGNRNGMASIIGVVLTKEGDNYFRKEFKNITQAYKYTNPRYY